MTGRFELVLRAASALVDGRMRPAQIGVTGGRIAAIADAGLTGDTTVTLADDEVLLPGLVDTHVHVDEPGRTEWEGFASATRAALAGGVTTIVDMPLNSIPPTTSVGALATKRAAASAVHVDTGFWGGAVPGNLGRLGELRDAGVFGFKAFLAPSGVDEFDHLDADGLDRALTEVASMDAMLIVHAEDPAVLAAHENEGGSDYRRFVESRPPSAETEAIARVIEGVRRTGARVHILHLSSAAALPMVREARAAGLPITVETCPHYLTIAAEGIPDGATQFKCCPPIRDDANRELLWQALVDGAIDIVVSDHSPSTVELKLAGGGDFAQAWGGIAGLQLGLAAVWTDAATRGIPLERVVEWMSRRPADLVGLPAKGRIELGADADLVAFSPDARFTVRATELQHRNPITAYEGRSLRGVVGRVWLRGESVSVDSPPVGRLLTRSGT